MKKVFLGGTSDTTVWRDELIELLHIDYFNPVVDDWTEEDQENELRERATSDFLLYVLTPRMKGLYSIAEVVDDSNKRPDKTLLYIKKVDVEGGTNITYLPHILKSLTAVEKLVVSNGGRVFNSLESIANYLNNA